VAIAQLPAAILLLLALCYYTNAQAALAGEWLEFNDTMGHAKNSNSA
jgi:hypothetical protein